MEHFSNETSVPDLPNQGNKFDKVFKVFLHSPLFSRHEIHRFQNFFHDFAVSLPLLVCLCFHDTFKLSDDASFGMDRFYLFFIFHCFEVFTRAFVFLEKYTLMFIMLSSNRFPKFVARIRILPARFTKPAIFTGTVVHPVICFQVRNYLDQEEFTSPVSPNLNHYHLQMFDKASVIYVFRQYNVRPFWWKVSGRRRRRHGGQRRRLVRMQRY